MKCQGFLAGFSEYHDGLLSHEERGLFELHRTQCPSCAQYAEVLDRSGEVVRGLPAVEVTPAFRAGIEARIQEERALGRLARGPQGSASTTAAMAAVAVVLAAVAWLPTLEPVVIETTLPAIAVAPPQLPAARTRLGSTPFPRGGGVQVADGFWGDTNALLHEYSALAGRYSTTGLMVRTIGFE